MILRLVLGVAVDGGLGFAGCKFAGCASGAGPLTRHPVISSICDAVLGALLATSIR